MNSYLLVFLGAGLGGAIRQAVSSAAGRLFGDVFPWGLLIVNVSGCLMMGLISGWLSQRVGQDWTKEARLFLTTGILGGYTTFSAFSLDVAHLWERGAHSSALIYTLASVLLSIAGVFIGLAIARAAA